jgi:hypothetical protein
MNFLTHPLKVSEGANLIALTVSKSGALTARYPARQGTSSRLKRLLIDRTQATLEEAQVCSHFGKIYTTPDETLGKVQALPSLP